jgi:hypothetical protein
MRPCKVTRLCPGNVAAIRGLPRKRVVVTKQLALKSRSAECKQRLLFGFVPKAPRSEAASSVAWQIQLTHRKDESSIRAQWAVAVLFLARIRDGSVGLVSGRDEWDFILDRS